MTAPDKPKIYHITHVNNLPQIVQVGALWSDRKCVDNNVNCAGIASSEIKQERLYRRPIECHPTTNVGEYVPFYYCPRSVLLYIAKQGNMPGYNYAGGQSPIIHLEFDLTNVIQFAEQKRLRWALSDRNAALQYAKFSKTIEAISTLPWAEIQTHNFSRSAGVDILEKKMSEFLIYDEIPIQMISRIGVFNEETRQKVLQILDKSGYVLDVAVMRSWYFP